MTANERPKLGAILLAAGGSSRMGRPKHLLKLEGRTLIRRAADSLANSVYFPVVVVLGADGDAAAAELSGSPVYPVFNDRWAEGISTSIRAGLSRMIELEPGIDGVMIALCDQPKITTEMFNTFAQKIGEAKVPVVSARYNGVAGVPALFSKDLFDELLSLEGDQGARQLIRSRGEVRTIDMPEAALDIDTPVDAAGFGITNSE